MSILDMPEIQTLVLRIVKEAMDLQSATPETYKKEVGELITETLALGMAVAGELAKRTRTPFDDIAVNTLRYSGIFEDIKRELDIPF